MEGEADQPVTTTQIVTSVFQENLPCVTALSNPIRFAPSFPSRPFATSYPKAIISPSVPPFFRPVILPSAIESPKLPDQPMNPGTLELILPGRRVRVTRFHVADDRAGCDWTAACGRCDAGCWLTASFLSVIPKWQLSRLGR